MSRWTVGVAYRDGRREVVTVEAESAKAAREQVCEFLRVHHIAARATQVRAA